MSSTQIIHWNTDTDEITENLFQQRLQVPSLTSGQEMMHMFDDSHQPTVSSIFATAPSFLQQSSFSLPCQRNEDRTVHFLQPIQT